MGPCADTLVGLAAKRDVDVRYGHKLVRIDAEQQQAFLQVRGAQLLARQNVQHHTPIQDHRDLPPHRHAGSECIEGEYPNSSSLQIGFQ